MDTPHSALVERVASLSVILAHKSALILFERLQEQLLEKHIRLHDLVTRGLADNNPDEVTIKCTTYQIDELCLRMFHVLLLIKDK